MRRGARREVGVVAGSFEFGSERWPDETIGRARGIEREAEHVGELARHAYRRSGFGVDRVELTLGTKPAEDAFPFAEQALDRVALPG